MLALLPGQRASYANVSWMWLLRTLIRFARVCLCLALSFRTSQRGASSPERIEWPLESALGANVMRTINGAVRRIPTGPSRTKFAVVGPSGEHHLEDFAFVSEERLEPMGHFVGVVGLDGSVRKR